MKNEEQLDRGDVNDIHRNMKTIKNWNNYFDDKVAGKSSNDPFPRNVLAGRQVQYEKDKFGYVENIDGNDVTIQTIDNSGKMISKIKDILKFYKKDKDKEE